MSDRTSLNNSKVLASAAIKAVGLQKVYGEVEAVAGVTFEIAEGEIFAYLGRNGSGKTTTVRILTTLTRPTAGSATVAGVDISRPLELRRQIGVTLQEAALDPTMTAFEHVRLVAGLWGMDRREARRRADTALEAFGLAEHGDRKIASFSGGMQRRLDICTSLLSQPKVLFLDEPTTGLDPQSRRALWSELRRLRDGGVTIFLTTQYLEEADELADHIAIVDQGSIIAEGTSAALKTRHGRTIITVEHSGNLDELRHSLDGKGPDAAIRSTGVNRAEISMASAIQGSELLDILGRLRLGGPQITHLGVRESSLEDVFLDLTGSSIVISADGIRDGAAA